MTQTPTIIPTATLATRRTAWLVAGGLGLAGVGLAAGLMLRAPTDNAATNPAAAASTAATTVAKNHGKPTSAGVAAPLAAERAPLDTRNAALCAHCGVIEGVRAVQRKGEGSGLGAVAGGVVGAVLGNQMGGGTGKTAMTVLGAVGGGLAGNEVEKRSKSTTVYDVRVRMDDGSLRSFTSETAPTPGAPVTVDDKGFHPLPSQGGDAPRVTRTAG